MTEKELQEIQEISSLDFSIKKTGKATIDSQFKEVTFIQNGEGVSYFSDLDSLGYLAKEGKPFPSFVAAGPRQKIFHVPAWTRAAIVTCGGLCPGINDVIKSLVNTLHYGYGVENILGIPYGYRGLIPSYGLKPIPLTPDVVDTIHEKGGSILGTSRGQQDVQEMLHSLERMNINILFTIGGDGTQTGAGALALAAMEKGIPISIVGIPKTIDNDINFMERTFGFETAVNAAGPVIRCAHEEAKGAYNGVGLVKLMGRDSGFIAACATLSNSVVNCCLIPEVPFSMDGPRGFLQGLEMRLRSKQHAVVVVAEGAGQDFFHDQEKKKDPSGNVIKNDIGIYIRDQISKYMNSKNMECVVKYFDPSYMIRTVPANGSDAIFCLHLAQNAVHAAMAGMSNLVVGYWHGQFTYVPTDLAVKSRRKIDPHSQLWQSVMAVTRQKERWL
ncbi:MAG: ATP-dependent 6-phosphofructokinase [Candidatus Brocadiae bacterium]|nr:ATP-dependent 6-phosphofructokinase [Candidatus Brocadiia bacterium]